MDRGEVLVIGLGRFGRSLAKELVELGHDVLAVDANHEKVQAASRTLQHVVQVDATDIDAMRDIGAADFETGVVSIGSSDTESSIIATYILVDLRHPADLGEGHHHVAR